MSKATADGQPRLASKRTGPLLVAALVLLGLWFGWSAVRQWRQASVGTSLEQSRDEIVTGVDAALNGQLAQLRKLVKSERVTTALANSDAEATAVAIREGWPGTEDVQVLLATLDQAYADPKAFGYSRLALLEAANAGDSVVARVVRDAGGQRLGLAAPVVLGTQGPALVYVRQPLLRLTATFDQVRVPDEGYLALRQGNHNVIEQGSVALADGAEALARPLGKSGLRLAAAVPDIEPGPLGLGGIPSAIVAVLLLAIAAMLQFGKGRVPLPRRRASKEADVEEGPTLRESLDQIPLAVVPAVAEGAPPPMPGVVGQDVPADIFRAYDIRGVVGRELTPQVAALIGQAIGSVMQVEGLREIVVGRDGRLSGPELTGALIEGLRRAGCDVIDIGLAPTPVVYFASYHLRAGSCVAVTGSHNPADYNGFKIVVGGETLSGDAITELYQRIRDGQLHVAAEPGSLQQREVNADYIQRIADDVQLDRPLKVVADAGNGVAGELAQPLLEAIGAEVIPLYCDVDGTFPNHHPDPSDPHNLEDLIQTVKRFDADIGLAFDGDGDRLGVVTREGKIIYADRLLMLFAADVLMRNPGALVIYDVKCSGKLSDYVLRNGGSPLMWKTGHSLMKAKMRETDAELAGEMSGHFFFKERWFGFDDGIYSAARLLEILSKEKSSAEELFATFPNDISTPEINIHVTEESKFSIIDALHDAQWGEGADLTTIDGVRVDYAKGWGLVRASNTTPVLVLRFEADDEAELQRIKDVFHIQLKRVAPDLQLPF